MRRVISDVIQLLLINFDPFIFLLMFSLPLIFLAYVSSSTCLQWLTVCSLQTASQLTWRAQQLSQPRQLQLPPPTVWSCSVCVSTWSHKMAGSDVKQLLGALLSTDNDIRTKAEVSLVNN